MCRDLSPIEHLNRVVEGGKCVLGRRDRGSGMENHMYSERWIKIVVDDLSPPQQGQKTLVNVRGCVWDVDGPPPGKYSQEAIPVASGGPGA